MFIFQIGYFWRIAKVWGNLLSSIFAQSLSLWSWICQSKKIRFIVSYFSYWKNSVFLCSNCSTSFISVYINFVLHREQGDQLPEQQPEKRNLIEEMKEHEETLIKKLVRFWPSEKLPFECQKIAKNLTFKKKGQKLSFFQFWPMAIFFF